MKRRSRAREVTLQLLFQADQNAHKIGRKHITRFAHERLPGDPEAVTFALAVYDGVIAHKTPIDAMLTATSENWRLTRMTAVDRNVLRLGTYELLYAPEPTPVAVAIDEAIELARRFGSADSPAFINGLLDKIARTANSAPTPAAG